MVCTKCGQQLVDGAVFCTSCGTKVEAQPIPQPTYVAPETPVAPQPQAAQPVYQAQPQAAQAPVKEKKAIDKNKLVKIAIIAAAAVVALIVGIIVLVNVIKVSNRSDAIFMVRDDKLVFKEYADAKKTYTIKENVKSSESLIVNNIIYDKKNNVIYFYDNLDYNGGGRVGTLYAANIKKVKKGKDDAVEKINTDVYFGILVDEREILSPSVYNDDYVKNFFCKSSGTLFFTKYESDGNILYSYKNGKKNKIGENIRDYIVSRDGKQILVALNDDGESVLKIGKLNADGVDFEKLSTEYVFGSAFSTDGLKTIYFVSNDNDDEFEIQCYTNGKKEKIEEFEARRITASAPNYYYYDEDGNFMCFDINTKKAYEVEIGDIICSVYGSNNMVVSYDNDYKTTYVTIGSSEKYEIGACGGSIYYIEGNKDFYAIDKDEDELWRFTFDSKSIKSKVKVCDIEDRYTLLAADKTVYMMEYDGSNADIYKLGNKKGAPIIKNVHNSNFHVLDNNIFLYGMEKSIGTNAVLKYKKKIVSVCEYGSLDYYSYLGKGKMLTLEDGKLMFVKCKNGKRSLIAKDVDAVAFAVNSDSEFNSFQLYR